MKAFTVPFRELQTVRELEAQRREEKTPVAVSGCTPAQKSHFFYAFCEEAECKLILTFSEQRAREIAEDMRFYNPGQTLYFPTRDLLFYQSDLRSAALTMERMQVYRALTSGRKQTVVVTTFDALLGSVPKLSVLKERTLTLKPGQILDLEKVRNQLAQIGYECVSQVEQPGQFAVRGGILDVFVLTDELPVRIELWGDEIDTIRSFQVDSQRSEMNLSEVEIWPVSELLLTENQKEAGLRAIRQDCERSYAKLRKELKTEEAARLKKQVDYMLTQVRDMGDLDAAEAFLPYFEEVGYQTADLLEYFSEGCVFVDEPARSLEMAETLEQEFAAGMKSRIEQGYILSEQEKLLKTVKEAVGHLSCLAPVLVSVLDGKTDVFRSVKRFSLNTKPVNAYNRSFSLLCTELKRWKKEKYRVILLCASSTRARHLAEDLVQEGLSAFYTEDMDRTVMEGEIMLARGSLSAGFTYPDIRFCVLTDTDIFGAQNRKKRPAKRYEGAGKASLNDLKAGDYVVHENHGLGIYRGIEKVERDRTIRDYMKIEYAKGGFLYVPAGQIDVIQKYARAGTGKPKLNRLGGTEWKQTKGRVQKAVGEIAQELVELYAVRSAQEGYQYPPDTLWQKEFEEQFPYEETFDQMQAIAETKADMESKKIMDRLLCGDVGYGKTEVAIRAAFKAVQEDRQVAFLVPTTILAQQHYHTFLQRMKDYPVKIAVLSRFVSAADVKKTLEGLKKGSVDIVIGTHRLLSKDVTFKDLGLLIIDEEQRFGVTHKEKIKQIRTNVDVLTLTATPIPRTLHMSLIGIRDMSVLNDPPRDRLPVQTYVMEYDEEMIREAIVRELGRNGQVYYVFNRIRQIADVTARIAELVPGANVAYAHGRMAEGKLEDIMYRFIDGEIDVLVSTTIIETGLDISNVNTMIIQDADQMGLSQLYQLRGRIGRSTRTSYAFLMYKRDKLLKEVAEKRLSAIRDFSGLGSGFMIAMKDLEIRGAGNLLGEAQSGHMEAVGYDLYCRMLNDAVRTAKGEERPEVFETSIDLTVDAYIPSSYVPDERNRLDLYKRAAQIESETDRDDLLDELIDRFGEPPRAVQELLSVAWLRAQAHDCFFTEIAQKQDEVNFVFYEKAKINPSSFQTFVTAHSSRFTFHAPPGKPPMFIYRRQKHDPALMEVIQTFLTDCKEQLLL